LKLNDHSYRPEIDGLRAISILSVVTFHFDLGLINGGYVGVDIFFVISGYLITRNIVHDLEADKFSLTRFYARRIRRLFPALLFTVAATFLFAVLWFSPLALRNQARDTLATLASLSNFHFWRETHDYFSPSAITVPLLHTWSLSVEEQFYVLWSIVLLAAAALRWRRIIPGLIFAAGVLSLVASQYWLSRDPTAAFYLMPFRIFELSIGALCIWAERRWPPEINLANLLFAMGLAVIVFSVFVFGPATPFPGVRALLPCLGAASIIYSGARTRWAMLLNNRLAVGIGLISYSLYLCHWPILVFSTYIFGPLHHWASVILIALSFAVATFMYFFIEKTFRFHAAPVTTRSFVQLLGRCALVSAPIILLALLTLPDRMGAWWWRLSDDQKEMARLQSLGFTPCPPVHGKCVFGDHKGKLAVEIIGDSHAGHLVAAFEPFLLAHGLRGEIHSTGSCPFLVGVPPRGAWNCDKERRDALAEFGSSSVPLVISQSWFTYRGDLASGSGSDTGTNATKVVLANYRLALERTIERYGAGARRILIVGAQVSHDCPIEQFRLEPGPLSHWQQPPCSDYPLEKMQPAIKEFNEMLVQLQRTNPETVSLLIPENYLCDSECPLVRDGIWYYQDNAHLTVAGAEFLGRRAHGLIEKFLISPQ
jgi:peptidoglycan/LPS O-acetylase OafA/YrhL